MPSRTIKTEEDRKFLYRFLSTRKLPFTVEITTGRRRSVEQNRLGRMWYGEIAEQLGDQSAEEVRGLCKLMFGVPILRAENETFREKYDLHVKGLPYETKLALMCEPLDFPVSRLMTTVQKTAFLDAIHRHFSSQGVVLTDPDRRVAA